MSRPRQSSLAIVGRQESRGSGVRFLRYRPRSRRGTRRSKRTRRPRRDRSGGGIGDGLARRARPAPTRARRRPQCRATPPSGEPASTPAEKVATPTGGRGRRPNSATPFGFPEPFLARPESARRHVGAQARSRQVWRHARRYSRTSKRSAICPAASQQGFEANGLTTVTLQMDTQKAFGLSGGTFNVSGLQIWGGDLTRQQPFGLADPLRHRGARRRSTLGAVVSAKIRRQVRHQDRRAKPRRGIHHQPERQLPLHQRRVRFSRAAGSQIYPPADPPIRWRAWAFAGGCS